MSERWFRFYERTVDNPKAQRLPPAVFKGWINLLCVASRNGGLIDATDIPFALRISAAQATSLTRALVQAELLDETEGGFTPHDWSEHQYVTGSSAAKRQKRYRERHKGVTQTVTDDITQTVTRDATVTVQEKDTDTDKSSVPKGTGAGAPGELFGGLPKHANGKSHQAAKPDLRKQLYDRGKEVFGASAGGIITNVLKAKDNKYPKALALIEDAAEHRDPVSWINAWLWKNGPPGIEIGPMEPNL